MAVTVHSLSATSGSGMLDTEIWCLAVFEAKAHED